jgi:hypothetical protein
MGAGNIVMSNTAISETRKAQLWTHSSIEWILESYRDTYICWCRTPPSAEHLLGFFSSMNAKRRRFSFGVAVFKSTGVSIKGHRCKTFDYSAKFLITITAEDKLIKEDIRRARKLRSEGKWVSKRMLLPGGFFGNDSGYEMDTIDKGKKDWFATHNINTVLDMKRMTASQKAAIKSDKGFRLSEKALNEWQIQADQ